MNCEVAQQDIALAAYGELADDKHRALEQHLLDCAACRQEMAAVEAFKRDMSHHPAEEPGANLLAQARLRLQEGLDNFPRSGWIWRFRQAWMGGVASLRQAPIAASVLLLAGAGLGAYGGFTASQKLGTPALEVRSTSSGIGTPAVPSGQPLPVANVSEVIRQPNSEYVEVHFNRLVPAAVQGSLDDPRIRHLLLLGTENRTNPKVQQKSVSLLAEECRAGHQCSDGPMRKALLVALRFDRNPGVRLKALNGLEPYVAEDMHVRDSVLEALMNDPNASVRSRAIELLQPVQADSSVQEVLHTVASQDDNPYIRTVSREVLDETPQIQ
jgi:hypothetical protein